MVTTLEMAVDSRGVKVGLAEANKALDETAKKADRAEREVSQLGDKSQVAGRNMSAAFAATGGGLAVTHGLAGMADGFRRADGALAAFAASQALLDMGRMAEDMKGVTSATGGAVSVWSKLGAVIKAHPIMTIATVLAGAASVMQIFGGETEEAANEMDRLATSMEKVRVGREAAQLLGISQLSPAQQQRQNIIGAAEAYLGGGGMTYGGLMRALGDMSPQEILRLQQVGGGGLPAPARRQVTGTRARGTRGFVTFEDVPFAQQQVTREAAQAILRTLYQQLDAEVRSLQPSAARAAGAAATLSADPYGPAAPTLGGPGSFDLGYGRGTVTISAEQRRLVEIEHQQRLADQAQQNMNELIAQGQQFGQTIGDAFFRVAEGTMSARQAMAELVRQFAQIATQGIFAKIGGAAFGATQTQATSDIPATPGVTPGN